MLIFLLGLVNSKLVDVSLCPNQCNKDKGECYEVYEIVDDEPVQSHICACLEAFTGEGCAACGEGRFGELCKPCPQHNLKLCAGHGVCNEGIRGTGTCICDQGFSAESNCSEEIRFLERWPNLAGGTCILILASILCIGLIVMMLRAPKLPRSAGAIILGICIGFAYAILYPDATFSQTLFFKPQIFFLILIPPIMFEAGFSLNKTDFFGNLGTVLVFAILGTMLTALIFGVLLYFVCNLLGLYEFSFLEALLFGSLISATDPVATISINKLLNLNSSLNAVIFGESVLNDAISIALFRVFSSFILEAEVVWETVVTDFLKLFFGSISIGLIAGILGSLIFKYLRFSEILDRAMFFVWAYVPYALAESIELSGILAILFLGMIMGYYTKESLSEHSKITTEEFFKTFSFMAENFCFVYFGISMSLSRENVVVSVICMAIIILLLTRAMVIFLLSPICNLFRTNRFSFAEQVIIWLSGARGAIAFSLALSLPLSKIDIFISTTQYIILFTILVLGSISYPIAKRFDLSHGEEDEQPVGRSFAKIKEYDEKYLKSWLVRSK